MTEGETRRRRRPDTATYGLAWSRRRRRTQGRRCRSVLPPSCGGHGHLAAPSSGENRPGETSAPNSGEKRLGNSRWRVGGGAKLRTSWFWRVKLLDLARAKELGEGRARARGIRRWSSPGGDASYSASVRRLQEVGERDRVVLWRGGAGVVCRRARGPK
jgi:hypothetical protein